MTNRFRRITAAAAMAAAGFTASSCTMRDGQSASYLIITSLNAIPTATEDEPVSTLQSDVRTFGGFFQDTGVVEFALGLKDPASPVSPNNSITIDRYQVRFLRADGRNTPGVDVPFGFDGAFTVTVGDEGAEAGFTLVRVQAKQEAPLRNLAGLNGLGVISTIAEVTFFGRDQAGRAVSATGKIEVNFADWGDPD